MQLMRRLSGTLAGFRIFSKGHFAFLRMPLSECRHHPYIMNVFADFASIIGKKMNLAAVYRNGPPHFHFPTASMTYDCLSCDCCSCRFREHFHRHHGGVGVFSLAVHAPGRAVDITGRHEFEFDELVFTVCDESFH